MNFEEKNKGFTLIELLVVIAIIGILSSIVMSSMNKARNKAYEVGNLSSMRSFQNAIELYVDSHGDYPEDVDRNIPAGIEEYMSSSNWPKATWPGSVYDWDNWYSSGLSYEPKEHVIQLSVRFCELGDSSSCRFPNEDWAEDFDYYSSAYWCFQGPCRAHSSKPMDHPGHCLNCGD